MPVSFSQWGFSEEEWQDFRLLTENTEEFEQTIMRSVAFWMDLSGKIKNSDLCNQLFLFHIVTRILHGGIQTGFSKRVLLAFGLAVADLTASRLCCESSTQHGIPGGRRF
jgi:hypothetical protein